MSCIHSMLNSKVDIHKQTVVNLWFIKTHLGGRGVRIDPVYDFTIKMISL